MLSTGNALQVIEWVKTIAPLLCLGVMTYSKTLFSVNPSIFGFGTHRPITYVMYKLANDWNF